MANKQTDRDRKSPFLTLIALDSFLIPTLFGRSGFTKTGALLSDSEVSDSRQEKIYQ